MLTTIHAHVSSITGRRKHNEDSYLVDVKAGVFAVLDGMGGYAGGAVASRLAAHAIGEFYALTRADVHTPWPSTLDAAKTLAENRADAAIRLANLRIREQRDEEHSAMGTTVALLSLNARGSRIVLAHLGDSRVYRLRGGAFEQLTCDHSLYEELRASGVELPPLADYAYANVITRALGSHDDERAELRELELRAGDRFLLCTDGLTGALEPERIALALGSKPARTACESLVRAAYEAGSNDNITAMIVHVDAS